MRQQHLQAPPVPAAPLAAKIAGAFRCFGPADRGGDIEDAVGAAGVAAVSVQAHDEFHVLAKTASGEEVVRFSAAATGGSAVMRHAYSLRHQII